MPRKPGTDADNFEPSRPWVGSMSRRWWPSTLVVLALGCGRSQLPDASSGDFPEAAASTDAGGVDGGSDSTAVEDASRGDGPSFVFDGSDTSDALRPPPPPTDGGCGPTTCPNGCCDAQGRCIDPPTDQECGGLGDQCTACAPGDSCKGGPAGPGGACGHAQPSCGPSNCKGCCVDNDWCDDGIHASDCGYGGQQCLPCYPPMGRGECVPNDGGGGTCSTFELCSALTCTGCCYGNVCAQGDQVMACGAGGVVCDDCANHPGTTCIGGSCQ